MKLKFTKRVISVFVILGMICIMSIGVCAAETWDYGYYQKKVYIQNHASGIYGTAVTQAADNWNNSGISPRSVVINTASSCGVYDDDFTADELLDYSGSYGLYMSLSYDTNPCSCHQTSIFNIFLNTETLTSSIVESTAAHELGHAFGLYDDHSSNSRLMSYSRDRTTVVSPNSDEVSTVLNLWNNNHS